MIQGTYRMPSGLGFHLLFKENKGVSDADGQN
jgi:hypothetical protein